MNRVDNNTRILDKLQRYNLDHPDQRFFQLISNFTGIHYLGYADEPDGKFHDLFFEEVEDIRPVECEKEKTRPTDKEEI